MKPQLVKVKYSLVVYPQTPTNGYHQNATASVWLHSSGYGIAPGSIMHFRCRCPTHRALLLQTDKSIYTESSILHHYLPHSKALSNKEYYFSNWWKCTGVYILGVIPGQDWCKLVYCLQKGSISLLIHHITFKTFFKDICWYFSNNK